MRRSRRKHEPLTFVSTTIQFNSHKFSFAILVTLQFSKNKKYINKCETNSTAPTATPNGEMF